MRRSSFRWVATGMVLLCAATWLLAQNRGKTHLADVSCSGCHLAAGNAVAPEQARRLIASQESLCSVCHKNIRRMSHPTGFAPKGKTPTEFPLDWKGDMTCSSCHEVHGSEPGLLRGNKRGIELCMSCHDKAFFDAMKDRGISLQQSGHAIADMSWMDRAGEIDALSLQCMGCHSGEFEAAGVRVTRNGLVRHGNGSANHPIGIPYPMSAGKQLRPRAMLSSAIWLPNGKLSCVSCHEPYKKEHGKLVLPNEHSSLCLQCHIP